MIVASVKASSTECLVAWVRRAARIAERCRDYQGPPIDSAEFDAEVVRLLRRESVFTS